MTATLRHWSRKPIVAVEDREQEAQDRPSPYEKPSGLWVSVEGNGDGWSDWCAAESFDGCGPHEYAVTLADEGILWVRGVGALDAFSRRYGESFRFDSWSGFRIRWDRVAEEYDGIVIAPYVWERRLFDGFSWYYPWDCASGCIWRARAVVDLSPVIPRTCGWCPENETAEPSVGPVSHGICPSCEARAYREAGIR